jgi:hypothetical protein
MEGYGALRLRRGLCYVFSLARIVADECLKLSLYGTPFRVYIADSKGLGLPYRKGVGA